MPWHLSLIPLYNIFHNVVKKGALLIYRFKDNMPLIDGEVH